MAIMNLTETGTGPKMPQAYSGFVTVSESGAGFINVAESGYGPVPPAHAGFVNVPEAGANVWPGYESGVGAPVAQGGFVNVTESGSRATWDAEFADLCDGIGLDLNDPSDQEILKLEIQAAQDAGSYDPADFMGCAQQGGAAIAPFLPAAEAPTDWYKVSGEAQTWFDKLNKGAQDWFKALNPDAQVDPGAAGNVTVAAAAPPGPNWLLIGGVGAAVLLGVALLRK